MDAMSDQVSEDKLLREELRGALGALASSSDRKHAAGLAAWYGAFTDKQRGFARVLLQRAQASAARGGVSAVGDLWETASVAAMPRALSTTVRELAACGKLIEAIKAHKMDYPGISLREAKEDVEGWSGET